MRVKAVPQIFTSEPNIKLSLDLDIDQITESSLFVDNLNKKWTLLDLEIEDLIPFQLVCNNYEGPVWIHQDTLVRLPLDGEEITYEDMDPEFQIEDYIFEPDVNKISSISNLEYKIDFIPRMDAFGDYLGDDIFKKRQMTQHVVFHGFYEDLKPESEITILDNHASPSFSGTMKTALKHIEHPIHLICYNHDIVISGEQELKRGKEPWITSNQDLDNYPAHMKFIIQCFELLRLTHLDIEYAEFIKFLAFQCSTKLEITNENYSEYSAALLYSILYKNGDSKINDFLKKNVELNFIEYPVFYSFDKKSIFSKADEITSILNQDEVVEFSNFKSDISNLVVNEENIFYELSSQIDSILAKSLLDVYFSYLEKINKTDFSLIIAGEIILRFYRVFLDEAIGTVFPFIQEKIKQNPVLVSLMDCLRTYTLDGTEYLYKNFLWGFSYLYNIVSAYYMIPKPSLNSVDYLVKAHLSITTRRDYIQLLIAYYDFLELSKKVELIEKTLQLANSYLFGDEWTSEKGKFYSRIEHVLHVNYIIPSKMRMRIDSKDEILKLLNRIHEGMLHKTKSFPQLSEDAIVLGLELLSKYVDTRDYDKMLVILNSRSIELFRIFYRMELYSESPDLLRIIKIGEYILKATKSQAVYSYLYPTKFNFTYLRVVFIINLSVMYRLTGEHDKLEVLITEYENEFSNKIDEVAYTKIKYSLSDEEVLYDLIADQTLDPNIIDPSMIYYMQIKKAINQYFTSKNRIALVTEFLQILEVSNKFENYRPKLEGLKLVYRLMLSITDQYPQLMTIKEELMKLVAIYNLNPAEIINQPITDEVLIQFTSIKNLPNILDPIS